MKSAENNVSYVEKSCTHGTLKRYSYARAYAGMFDSNDITQVIMKYATSENDFAKFMFSNSSINYQNIITSIQINITQSLNPSNIAINQDSTSTSFTHTINEKTTQNP